jgi:hypothetical protein
MPGLGPAGRARSNEGENDRPTFAIHESFVLTGDYHEPHGAMHRCISNHLC